MTTVDPVRPSRLRMLVSTLPVVLLLLSVIGYGFGEMLHAQLLGLGESWWPGYHELRSEPDEPECDPASYGVVAPGVGEGGAEGDELDALLEDDEEGDELDALLDGDEEGDAPTRAARAAAAQQAAAAARMRCEEKHAKYADIKSRMTPGVERFRAVEGFVAGGVMFAVNHLAHALALLLLLCAATATALRAHISLRPIRSRIDDRVSQVAQLGANLLLLDSAWTFKQVDEASGAANHHAGLHEVWMLGFAAMSAINLWHLAKPMSDGPPRGSFGRATLAVPLYAVMGLISGAYFLLAEGNASGLAIYLGKLTEHAVLYIHVGLYVWAGMLLKRTNLATLSFDLLRPWRLPPELLAFVVVAAAAIPTAYSGASGIFVIAAGAVIYEELRRAGSRRQLALAATAMSGSMGVVLRPCLLVVIAASLNKQVTTDQLFGWGAWVFVLRAAIFLIACLIVRQGPLTMARPAEALPGVGKAVKSLIPYLLLFTVIIVAAAWLLGAHMDEHSAPMLLPMILLIVLFYDRLKARRQARAAVAPRPAGFIRALEGSTAETTGHIGALLALMGLSMCLGGIVERAELMAMVPQDFGSVWATMSLLVIVLVIIGMTMDPYGAVILVSATIASVAYSNGIDPVHFWMVVLVAFELGYVTPPVALNHLLTRQVVGEDEAEASEVEGGTFYQRHERLLLPIYVLGAALVLVAFVPLFF